MKQFRDFSEAKRFEILKENLYCLRENVRLVDGDSLKQEIEENLFQFREKWNFRTTWINYKISLNQKIIYDMDDFNWRKEDIAQLAQVTGVIGEKQKIKEDIEWFEKVGGMDFFINVGLHSNNFELMSSNRFILTQVLTLDEKEKRIRFLLEEFEDCEEVSNRISQISNTQTSSKLRKGLEVELDTIMKGCFYDKQKKWYQKIEQYLEKDFAEVVRKNQKILERYNQEEYLMERLVQKCDYVFGSEGMILKKSSE